MEEFRTAIARELRNNGFGFVDSILLVEKSIITVEGDGVELVSGGVWYRFSYDKVTGDLTLQG